MHGSRPLTAAECEALGGLARFVDFSRVRVVSSPARGRAAPALRLILLASGGRSVTLGNVIFLDHGAAHDAAVLAHEVTHCGQFQRWGWWRYLMRGLGERVREAGHRHAQIGRSPYEYRAEINKPFESYGMEAQGQIVEDCFRGDPVARSLCPYPPGGSAG
ncbi:MAG: DUF4157 domain-containing protein [Gemmatimonadota bacterium]